MRCNSMLKRFCGQERTADKLKCLPNLVRKAFVRGMRSNYAPIASYYIAWSTFVRHILAFADDRIIKRHYN